jgi:hypothetical protein
MPNIPRRVEALEARTGHVSDKPWRQVIGPDSPEVRSEIADLEAAGFKVIHRVIVDPPSRPPGL